MAWLLGIIVIGLPAAIALRLGVFWSRRQRYLAAGRAFLTGEAILRVLLVAALVGLGLLVYQGWARFDEVFGFELPEGRGGSRSAVIGSIVVMVLSVALVGLAIALSIAAAGGVLLVMLVAGNIARDARRQVLAASQGGHHTGAVISRPG